MALVPKYIATSTNNLFNGDITTSGLGGFEGAVTAPLEYTTFDGQDIGGAFGNRQSFVFSNRTKVLDTVLTFNGVTVPTDLNGKTLRQILSENKYLIIVEGVVKIISSCTDPLTTPPKVRIAVSNKIRTPDPTTNQPPPDFWLNVLYDINDAGDPTARCKGSFIDWKDTLLNLSSSKQYNFGSTNGITVEDLEQVKSIGFSFFSPSTAAFTSFNSEITYNIAAYPKNADGSNPVITNNDIKDLSPGKGNKDGDNNKSTTNWGLIIGISAGVLALIIIIIVIIVVVK